jgi:hypothetical protein
MNRKSLDITQSLFTSEIHFSSAFYPSIHQKVMLVYDSTIPFIAHTRANGVQYTIRKNRDCSDEAPRFVFQLERYYAEKNRKTITFASCSFKEAAQIVSSNKNINLLDIIWDKKATCLVFDVEGYLIVGGYDPDIVMTDVCKHLIEFLNESIEWTAFPGRPIVFDDICAEVANSQGPKVKYSYHVKVPNLHFSSLKTSVYNVACFFAHYLLQKPLPKEFLDRSIDDQ